MSFVDILYNLLLMPLQMLFEAIYKITNYLIEDPGKTIVVFSFVISFLVLPFYRRTDAMQEAEWDTEGKLHKGVQNIQKNFRGGECRTMLQDYYRRNGYKPVYALRGAASLLLEIPLFIVAYRFFSDLELLRGAAFGPIADLGAPDGLLKVVRGGVTLNTLPLIMTALGAASAYLSTRGYPLRVKLQQYGVVLFFSIFLYNSPSGLLLYWTLKNAFSLVKVIFYRLKNPRKLLSILAAIVGVAVLVLGVMTIADLSIKWGIFFCVLGLFLLLPLLLTAIGARKTPVQKTAREFSDHPKLFFAGAALLAILTGLVIPSSVIAASPQEFVVPGHLSNPLWYLVSSCCLSVGTFIIWFGLFYALEDRRSRSYLEQAVWILCGVVIVNYMFFGKGLGLISNTLQYEREMEYTAKQMLVNFAVLLGVALVMWLVGRLMAQQKFYALTVASLALCGMAVVNIFVINTSISQMTPSDSIQGRSLHTLSKSRKNVVVLMLDRGMSEYIPYIMQEKPELEAKFDGFTFYANTISFGPCTNIGIPSLFGGYEYTPAESNKRSEQSLEDKQDEALKVMPLLFSQNGYEVTVCQPTYAGYQSTPDLSIFDDCPGVRAHNVLGLYSGETEPKLMVKGNMRNFFAFGITKIVPLVAQKRLYDDGIYNYTAGIATQTRDGLLRASGVDGSFLQNYNVLRSLPTITDVTETEQNTFLLLTNDTTHSPCLLQTPDYVPTASVDNAAYVEQQKSAYRIDGRTLKMENDDQVTHYHANMAAMLQLAKWFDYLRENDVYDNTKIIVVADHGRGLNQMDEAVFDMGDGVTLDSGAYRPLLMVKDFNATGFTTSYTFMTNADTPTLAFDGLIENPVNPFTGKRIDDSEKTAHDQYILASDKWDVSSNNGNVFLPGDWYAVHGDTWNADNWRLVATDSVSPEAGNVG